MQYLYDGPLALGHHLGHVWGINHLECVWGMSVVWTLGHHLGNAWGII